MSLLYLFLFTMGHLILHLKFSLLVLFIIFWGDVIILLHMEILIITSHFPMFLK